MLQSFQLVTVYRDARANVGSNSFSLNSFCWKYIIFLQLAKTRHKPETGLVVPLLNKKNLAVQNYKAFFCGAPDTLRYRDRLRLPDKSGWPPALRIKSSIYFLLFIIFSSSRCTVTHGQM